PGRRPLRPRGEPDMTRRHLLPLAGAALVAAAAAAAPQDRADKTTPAKAAQPAPGQGPQGSSRDADRAAVAAVTATLVKLSNKADARALSGLWTAEGEVVDESGEVTRGRDAIAKDYGEFFAKNAGAKVEMKTDSVRFVGRDTAIEDGVMKVTL